MGRRPTKAAGNPFCQSRLKAAEYNESFFSKEYAAEQLHLSAGQLQDYELGITKCIPPDNVLRMADLYNAPELRKLYCREMCPLGCDVPKVDLDNLYRIIVKTIYGLRQSDDMEAIMLEIMEDGRITEDEKPKLKVLMANLDKLSSAALHLKLWAEKNIS